MNPIRRVMATLPLILMLLVTAGLVIGFRIVRPATREMAESKHGRTKLRVLECKDYAFLVIDMANNRYRFEAWDDRGLIAAYSPRLDSYIAKTASIRQESGGIFTCVLDDRDFALWDGELWHKQTPRTASPK